MPLEQTWLDRAIGVMAPRLQLKRVRARLLVDLALRHYEGAATGRRTQAWTRTSTDANAAFQNGALSRLRDIARDLVRNNPYAESAVTTIADHAVGTGIVAKPLPAHAEAAALWHAWAETTACDADGRHDFYGLQKLVMSTIVESGEVLVRRRMRLAADGLPLPMQIQVLEPDYLDSAKTLPLTNGGYIIQGVEYNVLGKRVAYWLFPRHPGSSFLTSMSTLISPSRPVPASEVLHIFKAKRPGQVRAPSWFTPVILRMKDVDEFEDATIMKQKVAACLAVLTTDIDGTAPALGEPDDTADPPTDTISPGAIMNLPAGRQVTVVDPPQARDYEAFLKVSLRAIATGLHVAYEDLTGDYTNLPFSAARMSRLRHQARVDDWRWRMLVPQFCDPVWAWAMEVAAVNGLQSPPAARWTPEPLPFIDPAQEGLAVQRNVRSGIQSLPEAIRERGYDPDELVQEIADFNKKLDDLGIVLDSDPRRMSQAGQTQSNPDAAAARAVDDAELEAAAAAATAVDDRLRVLEARAPMHVTVTNPPVQVDARTTVQPAAAPDVRVETPITVQPAAAPTVRVDAPVTVTVPPAPGVMRVTKTITRDADGNIASVTEEHDPGVQTSALDPKEPS